MLTFHFPRRGLDWIVLAIGLGFVIFPALSLWNGFRSLAWTTTDGVVTYSGRERMARRSVADIRYKFSYAGREYSGDTYRFHFILNRERMRGRGVDAVIARYPVGEKVQVAVNPGNPSESVIETGPDWTDLIPLFLGAILVLFAVGAPVKRDETRSAAAAAAIPVQAKPRYGVAKVLAVLGILTGLYGANLLYTGWSSAQWPTAPGKMLYSQAHEGRNAGTTMWYEYVVDGKRYVTGQYRTGGNGTPFDSEARDVAKRYPVGREVTVYYRPSDPSVAVLQPGAYYRLYVVPAIGAFLLMVAWVAKKVSYALYLSRSARR